MKLKRFTNEEIGDTNATCGLDFDGTLTTGGYPVMEGPRPHAKELVRRLRKLFTVILFTCRTTPVLLERRKITVDQAVAEIEEWLEEHGIEVDGICLLPKPLFDRYIGNEAFSDVMACKMFHILPDRPADEEKDS